MISVDRDADRPRLISKGSYPRPARAVPRAASTAKWSMVIEAASEGDVASLSSTKSPSWASSSSPIGVSSEIGDWAKLFFAVVGVVSGSLGRPPRR